LRILEIGEFRMFKGVLPGQTTRFSTTRRIEPGGPGERPFDLQALVFTLRALRAGLFDLVVCYAPATGIRKPGEGAALGLVRRLVTLLFRFQRLGTQAMRWSTPTPIAALDYADEPHIGRHAFFLLERSTLYFKRGLPQDATKAFLGPFSPFPSLPSIHRSDLYRRNASKLLPISVGIPDATLADLPPVPGEKLTDLFFSGACDHSSVRQRGRRLLETLRERGVRVELCEGGLARGEYLRRAAGAWLAWSPEGYGWDCFRHYEALAAATVPVINRPAVQRYRPLIEGRHCRYYDPEGDDLVRVVVDALRDRESLARIAAAGREHVLKHFTHRAICTHIAASCGVLSDEGTSGEDGSGGHVGRGKET
jgi:hypothetical protein